MQPRDRRESSKPRSQRRERDVDGVFGVADHREGGQHVPDRAPIRGPDPAPAAHRRIEEDVGRVGRRGGGQNAEGNQRIDGEVHVMSVSAKLFTQKSSALLDMATSRKGGSGLSEKNGSRKTPRFRLRSTASPPTPERRMKTSKDRIITTHTGSLPRPQPLVDLVLAREQGRAIDAAAFEAETAKAVDETVAQQTAAGIDVVSDGEMSKPSYTTYIRHRVAGIEPDPRAAEKGHDIMIGRDLLAHPDFADRRRNFAATPFPGCVGPLRYKDRSALDRDLSHLKAAASKSKPLDVFMTAPSPGILTRFIINLHYPSEEAYVEALADAMKTEYRAIVEAGFVLQIDAPDLASARNNQYRHLSDDEFRKIAERNIAALNAATEGLPAD